MKIQHSFWTKIQKENHGTAYGTYEQFNQYNFSSRIIEALLL